MTNRANRDAAIRALRQSAVITNSAVESMTRVANKVNPTKQLRCWTAQQGVSNRAKSAKGTGK